MRVINCVRWNRSARSSYLLLGLNVRHLELSFLFFLGHLSCLHMSEAQSLSSCDAANTQQQSRPVYLQLLLQLGVELFAYAQFTL
mgnify:CR=1 FL=1